MNRMNRRVEYALMALKYMSEKLAGKLTSAKEICDSTGAPFDATARVMQIMAQNGLLKSEQGAQGGYLIVQDLSKVSFYDLMEMILGPLEIVKCLHDTCDLKNQCNILTPLSLLNSKLIEFYSGLSLSDLLEAREVKPKNWTSQDALLRAEG